MLKKGKKTTADERLTKFQKLRKSDNDWWDDISEGQKHQINEGLKDVEAGFKRRRLGTTFL